MRVNKSVYFLIFFLPFILTILAFFLFFSPNANASDHYIDKNASGANDGTSWVNAWESFADISWGSINPGDVIYISGGTDSTVYYETLRIKASGTPGNPITIRNSYQAGHNSRVILDGNGYTISTGLAINGLSYVYVKGLEVRRFGGAVGGVHITDNANVITIDSLLIYDNRGRGIRIAGDDADPTVTNYADSITVKNSYIITRKDEPDNQTDCIYVQDAANIFIHNNFLRMNQVHPSNFTHSDPLQAHRTRGWKISNNYIVCDQETFANAVILGAWDLTTDSVVDSVIFYNNFILATGTMTRTGVSDLTVFLMRWYDRSGAVHPPTVVIHNTIISYGRNYYNTKMEYEIDYAANNVFAQYGDGNGEYHAMIHNSSKTTIPVSSFDNNLYYREWANVNWTGWKSSLWTGKGKTGRVENWNQWIGTYGGNGINANPRFEYDFSNHRNVNITDYTMEDWKNGKSPIVNGKQTSNSPSRNKGLNLQSVVEGMGFEWKDINGNPRGASPDLGAYQY